MRLKLSFACILLIISVAAVWVNYSPLPRYKIKSPIVSEEFTALHKAEGKRIVLSICIHCHLNSQTGTLAGKQHGNPRRLGDFNSGNITQDSATGIGKWNASQLYYFLKTGIKPDGDYVFDMPKYPNLSEEDIISIIAFLKSDDTLVRKTYLLNPKPRFSFLTKLLLHTALQPPILEDKTVSSPDTNNQIAFGKYLATAKFSCYECHSLNTVTNNYNQPEKSWGFFKGGNPHVNEDREKIYTPNISGDTLEGIGKWSEEEFKRTIKNGIKPDGTTIRDPMFPFYLLSDKEVRSIFAYLKSVE
ncbi:MAG: cytochrome c [Bacteroidota bacterium]